ncbi:hypothetical protein L208DRAFT_1249126, partial [Tricholoma matsutake]
FDELGICHDECKQVSGSLLTVIGFDVDPNTMTITIVAVKYLDSTAIQEGNSAEIQMWIQQTKTTLELSIFLNCWIDSGVNPAF